MSIFAIGDLHLPGGDKKPMDVFGSHWEHHFERICADWRSRVKPEDIVLIPGDISWAMQLGDALSDLRDIAKLPGTILLLRGNHDFWWSSLSQLRACLPENSTPCKTTLLTPERACSAARGDGRFRWGRTRRRRMKSSIGARP